MPTSITSQTSFPLSAVKNFGLPKAYAITPVPGSCGPMTIAELLSNTVRCYSWQKELK